MTARYSITFLDASGEKSTTSVNIPDITAANFDTLLDGPGSVPAALALAIPGCSLCNDVKHEIALAPVKDVETLPADQDAQRETVLVVTLQDEVTFKKSIVSIPGVDRTVFSVAGSDMVNTAAVQWVALKAALENSAVSPDGNAVTVVGGRIGGRRN